MTNKIIEYRNKHPRCRYCRYSKYIIVPVLLWDFADYRECTLKDRIIKDFFYYNIAGMFCRYFECGDVNIDEV